MYSGGSRGGPPSSQGLNDRASPLSEGLDTPLIYIFFKCQMPGDLPGGKALLKLTDKLENCEKGQNINSITPGLQVLL